MAPLSLSPGDPNEYSCSAVMMKPVSAPPLPNLSSNWPPLFMVMNGSGKSRALISDAGANRKSK